MTQTLLIASQNNHKILEIRPLLEQAGFNVTDARVHTLEEPEEDGGTFIANARIKALSAMKATGMAVLADDSGLVIDALGEFPGVDTAPYAKEMGGYPQAVADIFVRLDGKPADCHYVCILMLIFPNGEELIAEGKVHGTLVREPRGAGNFAFDPWFQIKGTDTTFAELSGDEKSKISHRGLALNDLVQQLKNRDDIRSLS